LEGILREVEDVRINGSAEPEKASPFILNLSFLGVRGEVLLHDLERRGIMVSTGAACSSRKRGFSHVLKAMGLSDKEAEGAIRFSLSEFNTMSEMEHTVEAVRDSVAGFRRIGRYR
jgi:cysteine desulfurase